MSDQLDTRIRSFVAELLAEPPESPPLPRPNVVVIDGGRSRRRGTMAQTPTREQESETRRRLRGPAIAAAAFAVVILVVGAIYAGATLLGDDEATTSPIASEGVTTTKAAEAPSTTTTTTVDPGKTAEALVGQLTRVVGGLAGSVPDTIDFDADGTYTVRDQGRVVDTGVYEADGDRLTFQNDPTDEVRWTVNNQFLSIAQTCEGQVGEYTVGIDETGNFVLRVTWDECRERVTVANGLELSVASD